MPRDLFGPLRRTRITQAVAADGHWHGAAAGYAVRLDLLPKGKQRRVAWSVRRVGWHREGIAGTVFEAMDLIAHAVWEGDSTRQEAPGQEWLF